MTAKLDLPVRVTRQDTRSAWRRQYWVLLFAIYCLGFAIYGADPYVTFNRTEARIFPTRVEWQYPLIVAHVFTGVVTVSLAWVPVGPWPRTHHPRAHPAPGRAYLPAAPAPAAPPATPASGPAPPG